MFARESQEGSLYIWKLSDIAQLFALAGRNHKTLPRLPPSHEYGGYKIPIPLHYVQHSRNHIPTSFKIWNNCSSCRVYHAILDLSSAVLMEGVGGQTACQAAGVVAL